MYQECQQALRLLEQIKGYALLADYFFIGLALVFYEWNRQEEARGALQRVIHEAALWQQDELLAWGYRILVRVELGSAWARSS